METKPIWEARPLLDRLEDPFTMFPLESVSDTLFAAVDETETQKAERRGWWAPAARKYWSVEDEHDHDTVGLFLGAMFVLGQAAITQSVSLLNKLRMLPSAKNDIPADKKAKLQRYAAIESTTNESKLIVVNAVSNYFKHSYEWPEEWAVDDKKFKEAETIRIVLQLGMKPQSEITDNLVRAADCLGLGSRNPRAVAMSIQEWREAWARALYAVFELPDPLHPSS
jgi:hypothetical protein